MCSKRIIFSAIFPMVLLFAAMAAVSSAQAGTDIDLSVTPAVIDVPACEKGQICLKKTISIKNNSTVRADVYAQVNDLSTSTGIIAYSDPSQLPANSSLTRWIDFYRSMITIMPGETATRTLEITASPGAQAGSYHALISFPTGANLSDAQQVAEERNVAKTEINLNLVEHQVEQAEINRYKPAKSFFINNNIGFILKIKNIGNTEVALTGDIIVYNKGGEEVASLAIQGASVAPKEIKDFSISDKLKIGPGKFKAIVNLNYGQDNGKNLTDIVYFSYLPLSLFIVLVVVLFGLAVVISWCWHKRKISRRHVSEKHRDDRREKEDEKVIPRVAPPNPHIHHRYVVNLKNKKNDQS
jgi:hypothetical protein